MKHNPIFRKYLVSYVIILLIPSIAGFVSYHTSITVTQTLSIENSMTQLNKSKELLDRRMAEVEGFARQLAVNQDLHMLMNEKPDQEPWNVYGIWRMTRSILSVRHTNDFLQNFYIYLKNYNTILTPGAAYIRPEHYYEYFQYEDMAVEEWKETILNANHRRVTLPLRDFVSKEFKTSVVTYMQSLPLDNVDSSATIVVLIDGRTISSHLAGITDRYGGWAYVSDAQGGVLGLRGITLEEVEQLAAATELEPTKAHQFYGDHLVITLHSDSDGMIYRAGIPKAALMKYANSIKNMSWTVTGIALFVGLLAGLVLAYRNSAPIHKLIGVMKEQLAVDGQAERNVYDFLHGNISKMITTNKRLEADLRRQLPIVRDAFLKRLITGDFQSRDELVVTAAQAEIAVPEGPGFAAILKINGYNGLDDVDILNELYAARVILKQTLQDMGSRPLMTDIGSDKVAILFEPQAGGAARPPDAQEMKGLLSELSQHLYDTLKISVTAAIGGAYSTLLEIGDSYEQAKQVLEFVADAHTKGVFWYGDTRMDRAAVYYYPLDVETRLIHTIRSGEEGEARRIVQSIMNENTERRELSVEMKHLLIAELKGTLLKLLDYKTFQGVERLGPIRQQLFEIDATRTLAEVQEEIGVIIDELCGHIRDRLIDSHASVVKQLQAFIQNEYADSQLTLYQMAKHVERPEKYISQVFKDVTGVNLSDYLERVRMQNAIVLLQQSEHTVDAIAALVGYNSSHSFRRAFKRVTGVSPSAYRQTAGS